MQRSRGAEEQLGTRGLGEYGGDRYPAEQEQAQGMGFQGPRWGNLPFPMECVILECCVRICGVASRLAGLMLVETPVCVMH